MKDDTMGRVLNKLDKIDDKLNSIDKTLVKQEENLAEHMRRTELLEEALKPVEEHVAHMRGIGKAIVYMGILVSIAAAILKFFV